MPGIPLDRSLIPTARASFSPLTVRPTEAERCREYVESAARERLEESPWEEVQELPRVVMDYPEGGGDFRAVRIPSII